MAERKKKKSLWDDPSYGLSVRDIMEGIIAKNEARKRARIGAEEYQPTQAQAQAAAVTRELEGSPYSVGEEAYLRNRLATKQAALATSQQEQAALKAQFAERAALLKEREDRLRLEAGRNMGIIDTVPPDPEQFRAGERFQTGPSPTISKSDAERIMEDKGLSDLREHFPEGAYGGALPPSRADQFTRPGTSWRIGGQIDDTLLPVDPMGINLSTGLPSAGMYRAPDQWILPDATLLGLGESSQGLDVPPAGPTREEATAALTATDEVAPVNTVDTSPVELDVNLEGLTYPEAPPRAAGTQIPDASLNTPEFKALTSGGNDFMSRLARFNELTPKFAGISPEVLKNRERQQRRRDTLRAFQRMGPKDIVWSDKMTTAQLVAQYKRQQDLFIGRAMTATNPESIEDVNLLARKLGVGLGNYTKMVDLVRKTRRDYEYEIKGLNFKGKVTDELASSIVSDYFRNMNVETINPQEFERAAKLVLQGDLHPKVRKEFLERYESYMKAFKDKKIVKYDLPWGWKDTPRNREILSDVLGLRYIVKDPTNKKEITLSPFGGEETWLFVNPMQASGFDMNLNESSKRMLVDALHSNRSYHTGITRSESSVNAAQMGLIGAGGREIEGMRFSWNNHTFRSYAEYLKTNYKVKYADSTQLSELRTSDKSMRADVDLKAARDVANHSGRVANITATLLALDDAERAKVDPVTGKTGRSVFGGVAGLQLSIQNLGQLADDLIEAGGGEAVFYPGNDPLQAGVRFNRFMATNAMQQLNDTLDELNDPNLLQYDNEDDKEIKRRFTADVQNIKAALVTMLEDPTKRRNFQQNAIYADMLAISLATMAARMLSRKDRLLKDQYVIWKNRLDIHAIGKSSDKARAQIMSLQDFAKMTTRYSTAIIERLTPPDPLYEVGPGGGIAPYGRPLTADQRSAILKRLE
jgi:hypothetical protein